MLRICTYDIVVHCKCTPEGMCGDLVSMRLMRALPVCVLVCVLACVRVAVSHIVVDMTLVLPAHRLGPLLLAVMLLMALLGSV